MLSRGFTGELPHTESKKVEVSSWLTALALPFVALLISLIFRVIG